MVGGGWWTGEPVNMAAWGLQLVEHGTRTNDISSMHRTRRGSKSDDHTNVLRLAKCGVCLRWAPIGNGDRAVASMCTDQERWSASVATCDAWEHKTTCSVRGWIRREESNKRSTKRRDISCEVEPKHHKVNEIGNLPVTPKRGSTTLQDRVHGVIEGKRWEQKKHCSQHHGEVRLRKSMNITGPSIVAYSIR